MKRETKLKNIPNHIAIIPDGNRRWAKSKELKSWVGHQYGAEALKKILRTALDLKIQYLSFWASSKDNLKKRPLREVKFLLNLFQKEFTELASDKDIHKNKVKINIIGNWKRQFPEKVKAPMKRCIEATKDYNQFYLNFFVAYSGTSEILKAVQKIAKRKLVDSKLRITPEFIKENLLTRNLPPVDYLIRTGGEPHLSDGFMMWDTANSQLYFSDKLWPDFTARDFRKAVEEYSRRERRFGA